MKETVDGFDREIQFTAAFDRRSADPKRNYGIGGVDLTFLLHGPNGSVQFRMSSGWNLKHLRERNRVSDLFPMATDLGYHWPTPRYDNHTKMEKCTALPQGFCYYDGSTLQADPVMDDFFANGEEAVWVRLKNLYDSLSEENRTPASAATAKVAP